MNDPAASPLVEGAPPPLPERQGTKPAVPSRSATTAANGDENIPDLAEVSLLDTTAGDSVEEGEQDDVPLGARVAANNDPYADLDGAFGSYLAEGPAKNGKDIDETKGVAALNAGGFHGTVVREK